MMKLDKPATTRDSPEEKPRPAAAPAPAPEVETPDPCPFQPASRSLDIMVQARENLTLFRRYLDDDPVDSFSKYRVVSQCMVHAFGQFANRTADLEEQLQKAQAAATDFDLPLSENQDQKAALTDKLAQLTEDNRCTSETLARLNKDLSQLQKQIADQKKIKKSVKQMRQKETDLKNQLSQNAETITRETTIVAELEAKLIELKSQAQVSESELTEELQKSEELIKDLTAKARKAEIDEREIQAQQRKQLPQPMPLPAEKEKPAAFLIRDKVKISDRESEGLINMIRAIRKQNAELARDRDSAMVDIDCLMQENLGLKQIIQQIAEAPAKGSS
jgi:septal ring factor EnvC (AmiA/AmiB activator)